jgi:hypothetical protein
MDLIFKTRGAEIKVSASTNRKTCSCCNGSGLMHTDFGREDCEYCGGSGDFIDMLKFDRYTIHTKYFSKDDIDKIELIRKVHEYSHAREMMVYQNCSREQYPNPPEEQELEIRRV